MTSVIIPAHNEQAVLPRLLDKLLGQATPGEFDVLVVSNGSTDRTVDVASDRRDVRVIEIEAASKHLALIAGDEQAEGFPRLYVDADVELDTAGARAIVRALEEPGVLVAGPERTMDLHASSWPVRAYYRVWSELPAVESGLFGRGVLGVNEAGFARISDRPQVLGDDLWLHSQFVDSERRVVLGAQSVVHGPRTLDDLLRRRVRAAQGNVQLGRRPESSTDSTSSSARAVVRMALRSPRLWPSLPVFFWVTALGRLRAARLRKAGQAEVWHRDETSRE